MYDEDRDVDDPDRLLVCPYESSHKVTANRMNHHLVKCRKNYFVNDTEKTICPFNAEHVILAQEMETHTILCPDRPDFIADDVQNSDEKAREVEENVALGEIEEKKAHTNCDSDLRTDKESDETGCINGPKVGGLKNYNINSTNGDAEEIVRALENEDRSLNDKIEALPENGANEEKCDLKDVSVNAVSHMAGFEPQDDNIAIENQLSQSKANLSASENGVDDEPTLNGCAEEQFDYKKYAPTKEEKEEFLRLIKLHKEEQNGVDDKDESFNQNYINQGAWQQGYTYVTQPYHQNQSYPGVYTPGTTYIAYPNGYHPVINNGQSPYNYSFQPASGPVSGQYMPHPVQGVPYEYNHGYHPRQQYRPPYRRRNFHYNNHSHNRYNGYHKQGHYNGNSYSNGHGGHGGGGHGGHGGHGGGGHGGGGHGGGGHGGHGGHGGGGHGGHGGHGGGGHGGGGHGGRNHYNHYNGYYSYESYSHTDTDSNSSASGHSDVGSADHGMFNGNGHHSDNVDRPPRQPRRTHHSSKGSVNLESIIHVNTDSDGESSQPSINGHLLDLSPDPSESSESLIKRRGEKDKVVRKLRKKLNEIHALESKRNSGVKMDCDQLKKLTRKKELEEELSALTID